MKYAVRSLVIWVSYWGHFDSWGHLTVKTHRQGEPPLVPTLLLSHDHLRLHDSSLSLFSPFYTATFSLRFSLIFQPFLYIVCFVLHLFSLHLLPAMHLIPIYFYMLLSLHLVLLLKESFHHHFAFCFLFASRLFFSILSWSFFFLQLQSLSLCFLHYVHLHLTDYYFHHHQIPALLTLTAMTFDSSLWAFYVSGLPISHGLYYHISGKLLRHILKIIPSPPPGDIRIPCPLRKTWNLLRYLYISILCPYIIYSVSPVSIQEPSSSSFLTSSSLMT